MTDRVTETTPVGDFPVGDFPVGEYSLGRLVAMAGHAVRARWQRELDSTRLSGSGLAILATLERAGPLPQHEVAERCLVRPPTLSGVADGLEREGLVVRVRDEPDRRVVRLALTPAGSERLSAARQAVSTLHETIFGGFDPTTESLARAFLTETIIRCRSLPSDRATAGRKQESMAPARTALCDETTTTSRPVTSAP